MNKFIYELTSGENNFYYSATADTVRQAFVELYVGNGFGMLLECVEDETGAYINREMFLDNYDYVIGELH